MEAEYADMQKALSDWPRYTEQLAAAESLQKELVLSKTKAKYDKVKETVEQRNAAENKLTAIGEVDAEDVRKAIGLESEIVKCEGKLHGMDISARVKSLEQAMSLYAPASPESFLTQTEDRSISRRRSRSPFPALSR